MFFTDEENWHGLYLDGIDGVNLNGPPADLYSPKVRFFKKIAQGTIL